MGEREQIVDWLRAKAKAELQKWSSIEGNGCMEWADAWGMAANEIESWPQLSGEQP